MEGKGSREHVFNLCPPLSYSKERPLIYSKTSSLWKINILVCMTEVLYLSEISKRLGSVLKSDSFSDTDFAR